MTAVKFRETVKMDREKTTLPFSNCILHYDVVDWTTMHGDMLIGVVYPSLSVSHLLFSAVEVHYKGQKSNYDQHRKTVLD